MGLQKPSNLHWTPLDFESQTLLEGLTAVGFDTTQPSYFSWLGVTMYLTPSAIDATLSVVASLPSPSTVTIDFHLPDGDLKGLDLETMQEISHRVAQMGEPFVTCFRAEDLRAHLRELGFLSVFHLTPAEAATWYLGGRRDGLRAPEFTQVMSATV
jgi:O-methyltransferase involved in polyketide biosynthesis